MTRQQHKKISCLKVFHHICDNLDADLHSPQCRAIREHLDGCTDCVTYLGTIKTTVELYRRYPTPAYKGKS